MALPPNSFDCVVSIATLHHLPLEEALAKIKRILKPKGQLLILDLYRESTPTDYLFAALGTLAVRAVGARRKQYKAAALDQAWADHAPLDHYLTIPEIKEVCAEVLPDARIRPHIYFRYSIVWRKP
jgi:SAM-dependent methyltransferase